MASTHTNSLCTTILTPVADAVRVTPHGVRSARHFTRVRFVLLFAALAAAVGGLTACQQPLFDARDPRSQYDRTDAARNTRPEQFVMDEYGNRRPNIRGRLIGNQ